MHSTGAPQLMSKINQALIMKLLHQQNTLSRADLARATNLAMPTISRQVGHLIDKGYVKETHLGPTSMGKPPMMLQINLEGAYVVGLDITATYVESARVNLGGIVSHFKRQIVDVPLRTVDEMIDQIIRLAQPILDTIPHKKLLGLGVAVPGIVNARTGEVIYSVGLKWDNVFLQERLEEKLHIPVTIDTRMRARALGEMLYGGAREVRDFVWVYAGTRGIGAGLILDQRPYYGANYGTGEIGHKLIDSAAPTPVCDFCHKRGCLYSLVGTREVTRKAQEIAKTQPDSLLAQYPELTMDSIREAAEQGDAAAHALIAQTGRYLGMGLADIVNLLNPSHIYLGGSIAKLGPILLDHTRQAVSEQVLRTHKDIQIEYSMLGRYAPTIGAAALIFRKLFELPR